MNPKSVIFFSKKSGELPCIELILKEDVGNTFKVIFKHVSFLIVLLLSPDRYQ